MRLFSTEIQKALKDNGFSLICEEENIWLLEKGENSSVTVSGTDKSIEAIYEEFQSGRIEESCFDNVNNLFYWLKNFINE